MKYSFFIILYFLSAYSIFAQNDHWLDSPLKYISSDSVQTWSYFGKDFRQLALSCCPSPRLNKDFTTADYTEKRDVLEKEWEKMKSELNIVGGGDDEMNDSQGFPAAFAFSNATALWTLTGNASLIDFMERSVYNAAMRIANLPDSLRKKQDAEAAAAILLISQGVIYAKSKDEQDLFANLYTNCTAQLNLQGHRFSLDQITQFPTTGDIKFRLSKLDSLFHFRLHLRIPDWALWQTSYKKPYTFVGQPPFAPKIFINGREIENVVPDKQGYFVIDREWQRGDEVFVKFPLMPQYVRRTDKETGENIRGMVALQCGPLVYVVTTPITNAYFSINASAVFSDSINTQGHRVVKGTMYSTEDVPQDAVSPSIPFYAEPYADGVNGSVWNWEFYSGSKK